MAAPGIAERPEVDYVGYLIFMPLSQ